MRATYRQADQAAGSPLRTVLTQYTFFEAEDAGLVRDIEVHLPSELSALNVWYDYRYDVADRLRRGHDRGTDITPKDYDSLGRLVLPNGEQYSANGNRGDNDKYNRPKSIGGQALTYDNCQRSLGIDPFCTIEN